jgi:hypothetical protein
MQTRTTLALALAALTTPAFVQAAAPAAQGSGLLGTRYVEAQAFVVDYQNFEDNDFAVGTTVNLPVTSCLDVGASFEHTWMEGDETENFQDLSAYATLHTSMGSLRPFARAELGYEWWYVSDDPYYAASIGAECSVTDRLSVSASAGWSEFLAEDWNGGGFSASARANFWFTDTFAASLLGTAFEGGTWSYGAAAVFRF